MHKRSCKLSFWEAFFTVCYKIKCYADRAEIKQKRDSKQKQLSGIQHIFITTAVIVTALYVERTTRSHDSTLLKILRSCCIISILYLTCKSEIKHPRTKTMKNLFSSCFVDSDGTLRIPVRSSYDYCQYKPGVCKLFLKSPDNRHFTLWATYSFIPYSSLLVSLSTHSLSNQICSR